MDLQAQKEAVLAKLQQNKLDSAKHQEQVEGLARGTIYLKGQLDLVESLIKAEAEKLEADAKVLAEKAKSEVIKLVENQGREDDEAPSA